MAIKYCSWLTGNDTIGDGTYGNPYKTISKASTGLTGGDEVRVAKSPDDTALTGTLTFTAGSTTLTGSGTLFTTELVIGDFVKGADNQYYEVVTISSNTAAVLYKVYPSSTQSGVSSYKMGVTSTGAAAASTTEVQVISASGSSTSSRLKISGGWDLSTQTQTGVTNFRQLHSTFANRYGYALSASGKSYLELDKCNFFRYNYGIYYASSSNNTITTATCNSNAIYGISLTASSNNTIATATCNSNNYGIYYSSNSNNTTIITATCNSNSTGITLSSSSYNTITTATCNSNGNYGIYLTSSSNNTIATATCNSNNYGIYSSSSSNNTITTATCNSNNYGIHYSSSSNNTITTATCNSNNNLGIYLYSSSNNIITTATCNFNNSLGIYLYLSSNNTITTATCNSNNYGIYLYSSSNNTIATATCNSNSFNALYSDSSFNNIIHKLTGTGNIGLSKGTMIPNNDLPYVSIQWNNAKGSQKNYFYGGETYSNTSEARSGKCLHYDPSDATYYMSHSFYFKATDATATTLSAYIKKKNSFNGDVSANCFFLGASLFGWTDWTPSSDNTYEQKSFSVRSGIITDDGVIEMRIRVRGTAGDIYVDDLGAT